MNLSPFALNTRTIRLELRLSQRQLAARCDPPSSQAAISRIERGLHPAVADVARIAAALHVTPETLLRSRPRRRRLRDVAQVTA